MSVQRRSKKEESQAEAIYVGIDAHVNKYVVVRQVDGLTPQPAQVFRDEGKLIAWVGKQLRLAARVACCYEAGPTGYGLCRTLRSLGAACHVVAPKRWPENDGGVKTDRRDAKILCQRLESYERCNRGALAVVSVPTVEQERARAMSRQRELLKRDLKRMAQRGRMQALYHGVRLKGQWWKPRAWGRIRDGHPFLGRLLGYLQRSLEAIERELAELTGTLESEALAKEHLPKGLGALSWRTIKGEFHDFGRFSNRRQVGSFTGLCPREWSSGGRRRQGHVSKHGNPLLRQYLVEAAWRLMRWQPNWHVWEKRKAAFAAAGPGRRKQMVTAMARLLAIDIWRLYTGQTTMAKLGLAPA